MPTRANITKGRYNKGVENWLTEDNIIRLQGWARDGLTDEQIAENIGISRMQLYRWKKASVTFCDILKQTKEVVDNQVENALFKAAMEGNTTAQIFWLKNRRMGNWRDKQDIDANVQNEMVIKVGFED